MPKFEVRKIIVLIGEVDADTKAEAIRISDEGCASADFQVASTTFKATRMDRVTKRHSK